MGIKTGRPKYTPLVIVLIPQEDLGLLPAFYLSLLALRLPPVQYQANLLRWDTKSIFHLSYVLRLDFWKRMLPFASDTTLKPDSLMVQAVYSDMLRTLALLFPCYLKELDFSFKSENLLRTEKSKSGKKVKSPAKHSLSWRDTNLL